MTRGEELAQIEAFLTARRATEKASEAEVPAEDRAWAELRQPWPPGMHFEDAMTTDGGRRFAMTPPDPRSLTGTAAGLCADARFAE